ncbi:adenosylcobinamide-GDP ribazoletransferase [Nonomuraea sp. NPDC046802]|uniref:adenosylcobinamide-GDP ribazoletransferase n=1 Tax=Nonomuraea sp. NPDC046802 TaxID=3154919 RepID=UPI0033D2E767
MPLMHGVRLAVGTLSIFPVRVERVDRQVAGRAMTLAPVVGLALGLVAGLPLLLPVPPLLGAALAAGLLAVLTRGLHLDGLADLADGLGSRRPAAEALDIMKKSDIGPFGVVALVFTLLIQVAALTEAGYAGLVTACVAGRLAVTWACREGVPSARPEGLGAMVAGTVRPAVPWLVTLAALGTAAAIGLFSAPGTGIWAAGAPTAPEIATQAVFGDQRPCPDAFAPSLGGSCEDESQRDLTAVYAASEDPTVGGLGLSGVVALPAALLAGLAAALLMLRHAGRRLGGITGDVLGALVETATATTLVVAVVLG